jgi:hypothetical protein
VALADTTGDWCEAIEMALRPEANTLRRRAGRQAVARPYDWQRLVHEIARTLAGGVNAKVGPAALSLEEFANR